MGQALCLHARRVKVGETRVNTGANDLDMDTNLVFLADTVVAFFQQDTKCMLHDWSNRQVDGGEVVLLPTG
jgi:hypothetical protein